jgi:hypothetical protein
MKFIPLLFCISSLNAAVIVQDHNDEFGVRTTIELNDSIYTYRYDVKAPSFVDWSSLGIDPINRAFSLYADYKGVAFASTYSQYVPIVGSFTVQFDSLQSPVKGLIHNQLNFVGGANGWNINGYVPSVPEPTFALLYLMAGIFNLTRRIR